MDKDGMPEGKAEAIVVAVGLATIGTLVLTTGWSILDHYGGNGTSGIDDFWSAHWRPTWGWMRWIGGVVAAALLFVLWPYDQ